MKVCPIRAKVSFGLHRLISSERASKCIVCGSNRVHQTKHCIRRNFIRRSTASDATSSDEPSSSDEREAIASDGTKQLQQTEAISCSCSRRALSCSRRALTSKKVNVSNLAKCTWTRLQ